MPGEGRAERAAHGQLSLPTVRATGVTGVVAWLVVVAAIAACDLKKDGAPPAPSPAPSPSAESAATPLQGNAASGMPKATQLLPLAKDGAKCKACFFNARCALLATGAEDLPCCDYSSGTTAGAWASGGSFGPGHAAECLSLVLDAPIAPAKAKGHLQPLAKPGVACSACFFNGRCALLTTGDAKTPCCDYANGKQAGAWGDDENAARCLTLEANVPTK